VPRTGTSGYHAWLKRPPSRRAREVTELTERIRHSHVRSKGTYGVLRIWEDLKEAGMQVGSKRVARLMRAVGLQGASRRNRTRTALRKPGARPAPDLVDRDFSAERPDKL